MTSKRTLEANERLAPSLSTQPRCETHRHALLTREGECVTCDREAFMARVQTTQDAADARKMQALTRATASKRRAHTLREALA
jgi:hypothetical protein